MTYRLDTLEDAIEARNAAWLDRMRGKITQAELYAVLVEARKRYGQALYAR